MLSSSQRPVRDKHRSRAALEAIANTLTLIIYEITAKSDLEMQEDARTAFPAPIMDTRIAATLPAVFNDLTPASHADDADTRRSTLACAFYLQGCIASWRPKMHPSNHSEYCGADKAAREAKWRAKMFDALGHPSLVKPIRLFSDNQGAIATAFNQVNTVATKYADLADRYTREQVFVPD